MKYLLENLYDVEEKYKDKDVYYTFTGLEKVGINPHSNFTESPNAIYAYSMKDVKPTQTPFQGAGHVNTIHDSSNKKIGSGLVYIFELKDVKHLDFQKYKEDHDSVFYTIQYKKEVLDVLDPKKVFEELGENSVLLCWEKPSDFCHRHLVADWFKEKLGIEVKEL